MKNAFFALALLLPLAARADESARFRALLDEEWEWTLRDQPTFATHVGDARYDDKLDDESFEAIDRRKAHDRALLEKLRGFDRTKLAEADRLSFDLFQRRAQRDVDEQRFPDELLALDQMGGVYSELAELAEQIPRKSAADLDRFLKRIDAFPTLVAQTTALLKKGLEKGITQPEVVLKNVPELISHQLVDDASKSPIYQIAFAQFPETIAAPDRARLQAAAKAAILKSVVPPLRAFHKFVVEEYLPKARKSVGLSSLPDGAAWYAFRARKYTTTDLAPERIHQIGLDEVARIDGEMEHVMRSTGWKNSREAFFAYLRSDPKFYFTDKNALLTAYRDIAKRIDPELPRLFGKLPRLTYGVKPVPAHSEKTQTTAYYQSGAPESGRAGYYYANTYALETRPKWEMEALTLHEAVPGHHLQIALAQELGELPKFRRWFGYGAFVEGWGLYAESLGGELGMLTDPYEKFGQLTYEMWRAIRLVVDTGMHHKGWTRDQAIAFFEKHAAKTRHDIEVEVDRYIVWPGQALGYKIGQMKIRELRNLAAAKLGAKFDVRAFHDFVLGSGALPLDVLESRVRAWLDGK
jgi:uncharacterized protein (DUF885 family)